MTRRLKMAALALAALVLTGCGSSASHTAAAHTAVTGPAAAPSSAAPSPSPSPVSTARLTKRQAARVYAEIVDPSNRLLNAVNQDYTDRVPLTQFRRDERAEIASLRAMSPRLAAVRWPTRVEPYIRALLSTDVQADIRCEQDELRAHSYTQVTTISYGSQDCTEAQNASNASTIRSLLHLPSLSG